MEGIGSEVSHKIRAAIKAKLIELGAYVDDELPDYIMVMVANKRTKTQMDDDLQLFLSSNTKLFTTWLHTVLHKLHEVTVAGFDKAETEKKKSRRKRSKSDESKSKSEESTGKKSKKRKKQHKESKKPKKSKHKKEKNKGQVKKKMKEEKREPEEKSLHVTEEVGKAILGVLKKRDAEMLEQATAALNTQRMGNGLETTQQPAVQPAPLPTETAVPSNQKEQEVERSSPGGNVSIGQVSLLVQDEFNIEPLRADSPKPPSPEKEPTTVMVPTMELLKEHDKLLSRQEETVAQDQVQQTTPPAAARPRSQSEESLSPEELRKQLLLSRAKKKLEEAAKTDRVRSMSPDIVILDTVDKTARHPQTPPPTVTEPPSAPPPAAPEPPPDKPARRSPVAVHRPSKRPSSRSSLEQNLTDIKKHHPSLPSRVVTLPPPETPDIPSIVKVKPREFISKEKQANRTLILKAVAAAEKSVATTSQPQQNTSPGPAKKTEALYTKDLRGKRRENIAVTLTNDKATRRCHHVDEGPRERVTPVNATSSGTGGSKADSERDSDRQRNTDNVRECEDQFISSKPASQANDKYIECWLEGVHKAVEHAEMINPSEMELEAPPQPEEVEATPTAAAARKDDVQIVVTLDGALSRGVERRPRNIGERFTRLNRTGTETTKVADELKPTVATSGASKNKQLIAQLSEKFGKVDREFENKRKRFELDDEEEEERTHRRGRERRRSREVVVEDIRRIKSKERCISWPSCHRGQSCEDHDPTMICGLLPNCKLKDKCPYIHPICKDNDGCALRYCAYQHTSTPTHTRAGLISLSSSSSRPQANSLCKYHPNCLNMDCRFYHPSKKWEREASRSGGNGAGASGSGGGGGGGGGNHRRRKWSSRC